MTEPQRPDWIEVASEEVAEYAITRAADASVYEGLPIYADEIAEIIRKHTPTPGEGHGRGCYYCHMPCDAFMGDPGRWPIPLCHADDPGVVRWHHARCIAERLISPGIYEHNAVEKPTCEGWWWIWDSMRGMRIVRHDMADEWRIGLIWWGPIVPPEMPSSGANLRP